MTTSFRAIRLIALAVWVGSIAFFAFAVAPVAFKTMPDTHLAGLIVRGTLLVLNRLGLGTGAVYLFFTLALLASQHDSHPARAAEIVLVVSMMALTLYMQQSILPRMETDRLTLGGEVEGAPHGSTLSGCIVFRRRSKERFSSKASSCSAWPRSMRATTLTDSPEWQAHRVGQTTPQAV